MNWERFITVFILGEILVLLQALFSLSDGYFSERQMVRQLKKGYSFLQHGGMWADAFIITPLVAYLMAKYQFTGNFMWISFILMFAFLLWEGLFVLVYVPACKANPEAHAHNGLITNAGWVHIVYAALATWIIAMVYVPSFTTPQVSGTDIVIVSVLLVPWSIMGVMKFTPRSHRWHFDMFSTAQVAVEIAGIAILAWLRL